MVRMALNYKTFWIYLADSFTENKCNSCSRIAYKCYGANGKKQACYSKISKVYARNSIALQMIYSLLMKQKKNLNKEGE